MFARAGAAGLFGLVGCGAAYASQDDGLRRSAKLWGSIGVVIARYRLFEARVKYGPAMSPTDEDTGWEALHHTYADEVLHSIRDLGGFYVKIGQVLALRPDTLPKIYIEKLRTLEDACPPLSQNQVKELVCEDLGLESVDQVFSAFDDTPLGSASIGQVHRATLRKGGQVVAVKVQRPNTESIFRSDLATSRTFASIMAPEQVIMLDEIEKQFMSEFDYTREAAQLDTARRNMERTFKREVVVPRPILSLCTKRVLVMDYLKGPKLVDGIRDAGRRHAAARGMTLAQLEQEMVAEFEEKGLPPLYDGPSAWRIDALRAMERARNVFVNFFLQLANVAVSALPFICHKPWPYWQETIGFNPARVMDTIMRVVGHQMLVDGFFNADPHAGNILLLPDGRLGLIDYGQVKKLDQHERHQLCRLYVALQRGDREKM